MAAGIVILVSLVGCSSLPEQKIVYDHNSWKTMISDSCLVFFDGCNNCRRSDKSGIAACTRKACAEYKKPVCLD
jgi:hypothetical protein